MTLGCARRGYVKQGYTARDYVQNGLYAHFDAIDNAGYGLHDGAATRWVDLSGNGRDLDTVTGAPTWEADALYLHDGDAITDSQSATHYAALKALLDEASADNAVTVELGWQGDFDAPTSGSVWIGTMTREWANGSKGAFSVVHGYTFASLPNCCTSSNGSHAAKAAYAAYERGVTYAAAGRFAYDTAHNRYDSFGFRDGEEKARSSAAIGYFAGIYTTNLYTNVGFGGAVSSYLKFSGRIRWARLYSRALTDDELFKNYAIDRARFNLPAPTI